MLHIDRRRADTLMMPWQPTGKVSTTATEVIEEFRAAIESPGYELSALLRQTRAMGGLGPHKHVAVLPIEDRRGRARQSRGRRARGGADRQDLAMVKGLRVRAESEPS